MTLDVRHVYRFKGPLHERLVAELRSIPGIGYGTKTGGSQLYVPRNAQAIVETALVAWGVPYMAAKPMLPAPWRSEHLVKHATASGELHPWLFSLSPPTVAEPLRLLPFQAEALCFSGALGGGHLWQPGGSGKTLEAIIWSLLAPGPVVIVTRAAARETHRREWARVTNVAPFDMAGGFMAFTEYKLRCHEEKRRPVVILGWEQLSKHVDQLVAMKPASVVFDESHRAKQPRRARWVPDTDGNLTREALDNTSESAWTLAKAVPRRLCTTATAIRHRTWDLWGQLSLVEPQAWGLTATKFMFRYCDGKPGEYGGIVANGLTNADELMARLAYTVHRTPHEVTHGQLPAKRREMVWIPYADLVERFKWDLAKEEKQATRGNDRKRLTEIRLWEAASMKRKRAVTEIKQAIADGDAPKLFVVTGRRRDCDELGRQVAQAFAHKGASAGAAPAVWAAHGGTDPKGRQAIQDAYMDHPGPCVLIGTIDAWGESLNLHDSDLLLVVSLPYTPGQLDQLEHRVHRLGQDRPVIVRYLCANSTIDERVAELLLSKLPAVEHVVGAGVLDGLTDQLKGIDNRDAVLAGILAAFDENAGETPDKETDATLGTEELSPDDAP
jgi:hypothetical protein